MGQRKNKPKNRQKKMKKLKRILANDNNSAEETLNKIEKILKNLTK